MNKIFMVFPLVSAGMLSHVKAQTQPQSQPLPQAQVQSPPLVIHLDTITPISSETSEQQKGRHPSRREKHKDHDMPKKKKHEDHSHTELTVPSAPMPDASVTTQPAPTIPSSAPINNSQGGNNNGGFITVLPPVIIKHKDKD